MLVSAINAKQVEVKFNKAVDKDTAEDTNNYYLLRSNDASSVKLFTADATAAAELQDDGVTVVITATNSITASWAVVKDGAFSFIVDGVKDASGVKAAKFTQILVNTDKVAPTFVSVSASAKVSTNTVTLTFSEPVNPTSGVVKIDGSSASVAAGSSANELTVTTGKNLAAGQTYTVDILNFTDYAGNLLNPTVVSTSVTVTTDVVAPIVTNVTVVSDYAIDVAFDKKMDATTLSTGTVRLLDGNSTSLAGNIVSVLPKPGTTDNKTFRITIDNTPALPFNSSNVFNGTIVITDSVKDTLGNAIVATNRALTITKDTTKPAVASMKFVKADATGTYGGVALTNGAIVVKYNEEIAKLAVVATGIVIVDNDGANVTATYVADAQMAAAAVNADDKSELVIPLKAQVADTITSLTVRLPASVVNDLSLSANQSDASVNTIAVETGVNVSDTTAPVIASAVGVAAGVANTITIAITEANSLNTASVLDLNNYRLDGAPLPSGTYAIIGGAAPNYTVTLYLPSGSVKKSQNYAVNASGIQDKAGNTATAKAFNTVALNDDVKPVFNSATLNSDGTVSLGFDEDLATNAVAADFIVTLNSQVLNGGAPAYTITSIAVGADAGKFALTVNTLVDNGADALAGTADDIEFIDVNGDTTYLAGTDIVVATGATVAAGAYDLNSAFVSSLKVKTAAAGITGADAATNKLKTSVELVVK